jgi:hypothetical protein
VNRDDPTDEASTAGARQSALDFLRGQSGTGTPSGGESTTEQERPQTAETAIGAASGATATPAAAADTTAESESQATTERDIPGIIAIEDLDKLEGAAPPDDREEQDPPR